MVSVARLATKRISSGIAAFLCSTTVSQAFDGDTPEVYSPPVTPECTEKTAIPLADNGSCLIYHGEYTAVFGAEPAFYQPNIYRLNVSGKAGLFGVIGLGDERAIAHVVVRQPADELLYPGGGGTWRWTSEQLFVSEATAAIDGNGWSIRAGRSERTIANTADDQPLGYLSSIMEESADPVGGDDTDDSGILWSLTPYEIPLAGLSVQSMTRLSDNLSLALGAESLDIGGTFVGSINYADDASTAHVTVLGTSLGGSNERLGFHAGATTFRDDWTLRAAIAGMDNGVVRAIASASAPFSVAQISSAALLVHDPEYGFYEQAIGVSATIPFESGLVVDTGAFVGLADVYSVLPATNIQFLSLRSRATMPIFDTVALRLEGVYETNSLGAYTLYGSADAQWTLDKVSEFHLKATAGHDSGNGTNGRFSVSFKQTFGAE